MPEVSEATKTLMHIYVPKSIEEEHNDLIYELYRFHGKKVLEPELVSSLHLKENATYHQPFVLDQEVPLVQQYVFCGNGPG